MTDWIYEKGDLRITIMWVGRWRSWWLGGWKPHWPERNSRDQRKFGWVELGPITIRYETGERRLGIIQHDY